MSPKKSSRKNKIFASIIVSAWFSVLGSGANGLNRNCESRSATGLQQIASFLGLYENPRDVQCAKNEAIRNQRFNTDSSYLSSSQTDDEYRKAWNLVNSSIESETQNAILNKTTDFAVLNKDQERDKNDAIQTLTGGYKTVDGKSK
jgi:hypothetical protein